jgi:hypothetical protein
MHEESDLIQACAQSFGERVVVEQFRRVVQSQGDAVLKQTLFNLLALYALTAMEKDIAWFATTQTLSLAQIRAVSDCARALCAELSPQSLALSDAFALSDALLSAPIALDWVEYNVRNINFLMSCEYSGVSFLFLHACCVFCCSVTTTKARLPTSLIARPSSVPSRCKLQTSIRVPCDRHAHLTTTPSFPLR